MLDKGTYYLTKIGVLSAIAVILMYFEVPVPMMPAFLKLDISELPAVIGALVLGPIAGVTIEFVKNLLHAFNTQTMGIGELANFLVGVGFIVPAGTIYRKYANSFGAIMALTAGTVSMIITASVLNYYVLLPLYQAVLHFPMDKVIAMGTMANPHIVDLMDFIVLAIAPFNALKGIIISLFAMLMYKKVIPVLRES